MKFKSENHPIEQSVIDDLNSSIADLPQFLKDSEETSFGCPDCANQGGIYLSLVQDGEIRTWVFDPDIEPNPEEIQDWLQQFWESLQKLAF